MVMEIFLPGSCLKQDHGLFFGICPRTLWWAIFLSRFYLSWQLCSRTGEMCSSMDMHALIGLKNTTFSPMPLNWGYSISCCLWEGVTWKDSRVSELQLSGRGLMGTLSDSLGSLTELIELDLSHNDLGGAVPDNLFSLHKLQILDLSFNNFSDRVSTLQDLSSIESINISSNVFMGPLPNLGNLFHLKFLNVSNNSFTGSIPTGLCTHSSSITILDFSYNRFTGQFKAALHECNMLVELSLGFNNMIGVLPSDIFNVTTLKKLSAPANHFSGILNPSIGKLLNLTVLSLHTNGFEGVVPSELGKLVKLEYLDLHSNRFNGTLPASLAQCRNLLVINLSNNTLTGHIDLDFTQLQALVTLDLASNRFSGELPPSLSGCSKMKSLSLAKNKLNGELPDGIRDLRSLTFLSISNNSFHNISKTLNILQGFNNLSVLVLTKNFHGESIPDRVSGFEGLKVLALGNCALFGRFPSWLRNCSSLSVLDLSWNKLTGDIPSWVGSFQFLFYIDISNNSFSGQIPVEMTKLPSLVSNGAIAEIDQTIFELPLFVKHNQSTMGLQYKQLNYLPPAIYLSKNMISGNLWAQFGQMQSLHILEIKNNRLTGKIPPELSNMTNLESLDLSDNNLIGEIPTDLQDLTFLSKFNVANNHLEGTIPTGRQFATFSISSYTGNPNLCGAPLRPCASNSSNYTNRITGSLGPSRLSRRAIAGIAVSVGCVVALLFTVVLWSVSKHNMISDVHISEIEYCSSESSSDDPGSSLLLIFQNHDLKDLSIADIFHATNNFDQANIIGCGGFGLVYKATFANGTTVAIKKLTGDCGQMEREFRAEVEALSRARHKNLVALLGYCRYGDCRLLIYSYLENGSLDHWLHEKPDGGALLDWPLRLKVAKGASKGLAYMHRIDPHIVHRDIKSSNILLDDQFEGYVADFGLSRLILPYNTHVTTELVGTLGYIPPEYGQAWIATLRGDVYSFGVVLLELLTRRRPVEVCKPKLSTDLVTWVHQMKSEDKQEEVLDPILCGKGYENQMLQVLDVACMCTAEIPFKRPTIQEVVDWLDNVGNDK